MKKYILIFALLSILVACKKDDPEPEPETPDYADGLVGTYVGTEINYGTDNSSKEYENTSKTMVVTKLEKNKIKVESFQGNYTISFTTTASGNDILLAPNAPYQAYGTGNCKYLASTKKLGIYVKDVNSLKYKYYLGTKQ